MQFIIENLGTIAVLLVVAVISGFATYSVIKNRKKGCSSCGGSCGNCSMACTCHPQNEEKKNPTDEENK